MTIEVQNVFVSNAGFNILENINLSINSGEIWAIIGKSGSGKSSLLKLLAGQLPVTSGRLVRRLQVVRLVDHRHSFTNLSNTQNLYYQQRFNSSDAEDAYTVEDYLFQQYADLHTCFWTVARVTDLFELTALLKKQTILLSNGETRRVMLAAALLKQPELLLLDNALSGLDNSTRAKLSAILRQISSRGTIIVMTASLADIPDAVTHLAVLDSGKIVQAAKKEEVDLTSVLPEKSLLNELSTWLANYKLPLYETIVRLENVRIEYGNKVLLDGINWQINQGDRWALSGPNGAGKSTLISLITGDNPQAYANKILLFDKPRGSGESIWDIKRKIGFMSPELFQYFPLETTVEQAIESGIYDTVGLFRKPSEANGNQVAALLQGFELHDYAQRRLQETPTGIQRLTLIARALIKQPVLLILDEPCQGLDTTQVKQLLKLMDTICQHTSVSMIYVSHYANEIPSAVNKRLQLVNGRTVEPKLVSR